MANAGAELAEVSPLEVRPIDVRDADIALTATGEAQARALGSVLPELRPELVLSSPYRRAVETAELAVGGSLPILLDERLRDRETGVLEQLTPHGEAVRYPEEAARRARLGVFYYRPPGGEAWTDIALRLRGVLRDLRDGYPDGRVLLVAHEAVVLLLRYLVENLTEGDVVQLATARVRNASLTSWARHGDRLRLTVFDDTTHLSEAGVVATPQTRV